MKLASGNFAATRAGRIDQLRRDRASSQAMRTAFPGVEKLSLVLKFAGSHSNIPATQLHELYPPARAFFTFPCPYAGCDGHFNLTAAVRAAVEGDRHLAEGIIDCSGSRPRDYASRQTCLLQLRYEVSVLCEKGRKHAVRTGSQAQS